MVLWETVLSPALQVLFEKLASGDIMELLRRWNFDDILLEKLKIAYFTCTVVMDDAEEKQYDNPAIQTWLDMLKIAVYEAEDALDELATEALSCKVESIHPQNFSNQVRNWNILASNLNPFKEGIELKMEKLIDKLEFIAKQKDILGLESSKKGRYKMINRGPTTPLLSESCIYGRDSEKEEMFKLLFVDDDSTCNNIICIIPILGLGGIGKTTLAQIVYNEKIIDDAFDVKAWACVSDDFNVISITKALVESSTGVSCETTNLELLQSRLKQILSKKKFLIVLDDVWNEDSGNWNDLLIPFTVGALGSRIIVTTRNEGVLSGLRTLPPYHMKEMSDDSCWQLFLHHVFGGQDSGKYLPLKEVGREIVNKCKGLPLAVKMLGGLLSSKLDIDYWNDISKSNLWDLPPKKNVILPSLRLSYHHLPSNLKRCFSYCSIFPKGYEFDRKKLVLLWMAEGFLQPVESNSAEDVGEEYFSELLSRSFFQESVQNSSRYVMHDLVDDLAQSVSRRICIRQQENWKENYSRSLEKARHFSYIRSKYDVFKRFELLPEVKWLRTFLPLSSITGEEVCYLSKKVPLDLLPKLRCLRVLSLSGYCITEVPESIGNLKLIRYIDLSYTQIESLPESLGFLCNLQTLFLCYCERINKLPANLGKLVNLRHLDITGSGIQEMPIGIGNLVSLRELPEFILGSAASRIGTGNSLKLLPELISSTVCARIAELRNLVHLEGSLTISGLEHVVEFWDARRANLKGKRKLNKVHLDWSRNFNELQSEVVAADVLEMLQPHKNLKELTINCYPGTKFPTWISDPVFSTLVSLSLSDCTTCRFLPPLGRLPSLKELHIKGMVEVKSVGMEFYGCNWLSFIPFPLLETLSFVEMSEWEDWSLPTSAGDLQLFPSLKQLYVEQCPKLHGKLPEHLPSLVKLVLSECGQLSTPLPSLPRLNMLNLRECNHMLLSSDIDVNLLASFELCNISNLTYLPEQLLSCMTRLQRLLVIDCSRLTYLVKCKDGSHYLASLQHLVLRNCSLLISLFEEEQQLPQGLEYLELDSCQSLKKLPQTLHRLSALQELIITDCPRLQFVHGTIFPSNLKGLVLRGCGLDFLTERMLKNISSLGNLYISGCLVLSSFPRGGGELLPTTFKQLTIDHCPNLEFLPDGMMQIGNSSLELLEIFDCPSIMSLPAGQLPTTLKTITLWNCPNLQSISVAIPEMIALESLRIGNCTNFVYLPNNLYKLRYLEYFEIDGCPGIVSFPDGGLPAASLKRLRVLNCEHLKFLPEWMQNLTSLQELQLSNCPSITSFPEGGLPTNLVSLEISDCENIMPLFEWGLHRFPALKELKVSGSCQDVVFPAWLLPSTLDTLHIEKLPKLQTLSPWLQNLTSLEELKIKECRKLISMPKEGVPPMLSYLEISGCSLLRQNCEKNWSEIDHVPCIVM